MTRTARTAARTAVAALAAGGLAVAAAPAASANPLTESLMPHPACEVDAQALADATPHPLGDVDWVVGEVSNVCGNLGFIVLETEGGTLTSPTHVELYHRGHAVATQPDDIARILVGGRSDFHVELQIQQPPSADQPNAAARYLTTAYVWNPLAGDAMPIGPLPQMS